MKSYLLGLLTVVLLVVAGCGADVSTRNSDALVANTDARRAATEGLKSDSRATQAAASTQEILGRVVGVTDGDTITVLDASQVTHKIRLKHVDAPERKQDFGSQAKTFMSEQVFDQQVRIEWSEKDRYGRTLGEVFVGDRWINRELVSAGLAWHYRQYSDDLDVSAAEADARQQARGLWSVSNPVPPWEFRHGTSGQTASTEVTSDEPQGDVVYVTRTGKKYHQAGCRHLSASKIKVSLAAAKQRYSPCAVCNPEK